MTRSSRQSKNRKGSVASAPMRRPGAVGRDAKPDTAPVASSADHPLCDEPENARLFAYERDVKQAFDQIVDVLKQVSALQHEAGFEERAQQLAQAELGYTLPDNILADAWVTQLDMRQLFAWCVFSAYQVFCADFFEMNPLAADVPSDEGEDFQHFLQECGFHTLDISPCADGRLAHVIRYVLRLPQGMVRRKSYAGALFDIENSVEKWVETEMLRYREAKPNAADAPTRYLKMVAYHFSSVDPEHQGCAAHGSDTEKAARAGLERLEAFREAVENSFSSGASIDLLLIGVDTDTDSLRFHVPDAAGDIDLSRFVDTLDVYKVTQFGSAEEGREFIANQIRSCSPEVSRGTLKLSARLIENNLSQIQYVRRYFGEVYPDIGHAERFIGAGVGFEEIQLRNLMYFSYLNTVEEAAPDLDVGISIFKGLNVARDLPIPVIIRFDYHGQVPGARDRAIAHCARIAAAMKNRYQALSDQGLLHMLQAIRDCQAGGNIEVLDSSIQTERVGAH